MLNVGYMEWEALRGDTSSKAAALLQALSAELGPVTSWQHVGPPTRAPGSLVADAEAAQAAAAAEQRQHLLHQQRDLMLAGWNGVGSSGSGAPMFAVAVGSQAAGGSSMFVPGMLSGLQGGVAAAAAAAGLLGGHQQQDSSNNWAAGIGAPMGGSSSTTTPLGALGVWGSGALTGLNGGGALGGPSLLQELTRLQQQLQQQQAWDAFLAADDTTRTAAGPGVLEAAGGRRTSMEQEAVAAATARPASSLTGGNASLPPSPASTLQGSDTGAAAAAGPDVLPGAEELQAALAAAHQKWNSSPSSTRGSSGSGNYRKAAGFLWGDPTAASIWAP